MGRLQNKVSIITGAAQGIGLATALKFAQEGAIVVVCDLKQAAIDEAVAACRQAGAQAEGFLMDVTDRDQVDAVVARVRERFGRIDVLVNNAGITQDARLVKMTQAQFDRVIDVNLRGVFHCAQAVAEGMTAQGSGVILNASSVVGIYGNFGQTNYAATKFGVIGFTKTWARELGAKGVRVNAVSPYADTQMTQGYLAEDLARCLRPEAVAPLVTWLAGESCAANGEVFVAGGGRFRRGFSVETDSLAGEDIAAVVDALRELPGRPHPSSNHAFATLVEELRQGGQIR